MRALAQIAVALALGVCLSTQAEIEKTVTICEKGICPHWWPKVAPPDGWQQDREQSYNYEVAALAPIGQTFTDAEAIIYANAVYKPRVPEAKALADFIAQDQQSFKERTPDLVIRRADELRTADGKLAATWLLEPAAEGQWERIAYFEEGDFYMVFVLSSRTSAGLKAATAAFENLVRSYKE